MSLGFWNATPETIPYRAEDAEGGRISLSSVNFCLIATGWYRMEYDKVGCYFHLWPSVSAFHFFSTITAWILNILSLIDKFLVWHSCTEDCGFGLVSPHLTHQTSTSSQTEAIWPQLMITYQDWRIFLNKILPASLEDGVDLEDCVGK